MYETNILIDVNQKIQPQPQPIPLAMNPPITGPITGPESIMRDLGVIRCRYQELTGRGSMDEILKILPCLASGIRSEIVPPPKI